MKLFNIITLFFIIVISHAFAKNEGTSLKEALVISLPDNTLATIIVAPSSLTRDVIFNDEFGGGTTGYLASPFVSILWLSLGISIDFKESTMSQVAKNPFQRAEVKQNLEIYLAMDGDHPLDESTAEFFEILRDEIEALADVEDELLAEALYFVL